MKDISTEKIKLRKEIALLKSELSSEELKLRSEEVFATLEALDIFQQAKNIFIYNSLSDEVQTIGFVNRWMVQKNFYMPAIMPNGELSFRQYTSYDDLRPASLGILEPQGRNYTDYHKIDMIIVPGVAFDRQMNRLGRGKGYYDRFLSRTTIPRMGVCFDLQLRDRIPSETHDIKMNYIVSENEILWL